MKANKELFVETVKRSKTKIEVIQKLGGNPNGSTYKFINDKIKEWNVDIAHFLTRSEINRKYPLIEIICPVCDAPFITSKGSKSETSTCSYSCANTYFKSGENNGNWKQNVYRSTCFRHHKKECIICGESNIIAVHHFDGNHDNNVIENLIPLCPTHHAYMHRRYKHLIINKVKKYIHKFIFILKLILIIYNI